MGKQLLRGGLALTALAAATAISWASDQPQAHAEPECLNASNDFNRDGTVDVAVGTPGANANTGAVEVRVSTGEETTIHRIEAPDGSPGDEFGAALAEVASADGETDQDRCSQLVIGAPGKDVQAKADAGAVYLYRWDSATDAFALVKRFTQGNDGAPGSVQDGAQFGRALAAPHHGDDIGPVVTPLYVGVPGYSVNGAVGAGAFASLKFSTGTEAPVVEEGTLMQQGADGIPGGPEAGDGFGSSLAVTDVGVLVGAPYEDIGSVRNAGAFIRWRADDTGGARFVSQRTTGVPGTPEAGDRFGEAIYSARETTPSGGGHFVLVGAPGEDIGSVRNAGAAVRFVYHGDLDLARTKGFSQNKDGMAGRPEAGDRLGTSFGSFGTTHLLVGVPGEGIGSIANAGMVQSLGGGQSWHQDKPGVPGTAEAGDLFGLTMGNALYGMGSLGEDGWLGEVVVGVPGENDFAGIVIAGLPGGPGGGSSTWKPQSPSAGDRYGAALGKTN